MFFIIIGMPVISEASLAFFAEKKGVSKDAHSTHMPCLRKNTPARMLSNPPEESPNAFIFFMLIIYILSVLSFFFVCLIGALQKENFFSTPKMGKLRG